MTVSAKQFFYVMIAITVLSFGGILGAFYWGDQQLQAKASTLADLQTDRDIAQAKIIALQQAKQSTQLAEDTDKLLATLLPQQKQQEELIADVIYTASSESGIPLQSIGALTFAGNDEPSDLSGTEQSKEISGVYSYPFSISVQEISYATLLKLLNEIENNGRLVQIDDVQITPDKNNPGQLSSVSLTLKAFLKP
jgi:Tfp pilus assembly protein PilO